MAEEKKKRPHRRAYLNDFKRNVAGEYVYTGKHFRWRQEPKPVLLRMWLQGGIAALAALANGCIPNTGMDRYVWTLLPWVISFISALSVVYAVGRLSFGGERVRAYVLEGSVGKIPMRTGICSIAAAVSAVGGIVNLFLPNFAGNILCAVIFVLLQGVTGGLCVLLRRTVAHLEWAEE